MISSGDLVTNSTLIRDIATSLATYLYNNATNPRPVKDNIPEVRSHITWSSVQTPIDQINSAADAFRSATTAGNPAACSQVQTFILTAFYAACCVYYQSYQYYQTKEFKNKWAWMPTVETQTVGPGIKDDRKSIAPADFNAVANSYFSAYNLTSGKLIDADNMALLIAGLIAYIGDHKGSIDHGMLDTCYYSCHSSCHGSSRSRR